MLISLVLRLKSKVCSTQDVTRLEIKSAGTFKIRLVPAKSV